MRKRRYPHLRKQSLGAYVIEQHLEEIAVNNCRWMPKHGRVIINAVVEWATPCEFWTQIWRSSKFYRVVDAPERGFEIMYVKVKNKQYVRSAGRKCNALREYRTIYQPIQIDRSNSSAHDGRKGMQKDEDLASGDRVRNSS